MPENPTSRSRMLAPAEAAELLGVSVAEVLELVHAAQLRGVRVGSPARWRIEAGSVERYLDDRVEEARRMALWRQSNEASFPELWGTGVIRDSD
ncbi:helix-turn-helix domain-containing protein [Microbacterium sp. BK668]|uniref:helix-turn-helix domain-containing protein n=1 Tax=Microbacterium sp. BK668 TaxID=2512118 RepID=UPI0010ED74AB|nr:helix-turn-helix domain-containing protein [Microbacterium sp. BK668]TDN88435.1 excisionase family DNA binding protein [Microbacterium sp. BK668]